MIWRIQGHSLDFIALHVITRNHVLSAYKMFEEHLEGLVLLLSRKDYSPGSSGVLRYSRKPHSRKSYPLICCWTLKCHHKETHYLDFKQGFISFLMVCPYYSDSFLQSEMAHS